MLKYDRVNMHHTYRCIYNLKCLQKSEKKACLAKYDKAKIWINK